MLTRLADDLRYVTRKEKKRAMSNEVLFGVSFFAEPEYQLSSRTVEAAGYNMWAALLPPWWQWTVVLTACLDGFLTADSPVKQTE